MRRIRRLSALAALSAALAAAPAAAQSPPDLPPALHPRPLPAALVPESATAIPSVELAARGGRPVWLLPAAGLVAGALLYPVLVDGGCDDTDCTVYIPEPATGALIGLLGGILLEVGLMIAEGGVGADPPALITREPSAAQPGTGMLP